MSHYVAVDPALALPGHFRPTEATLRLFDPMLRLRKSVDRALIRKGCGFILERRSWHTKPPDVLPERTQKRGLTDTAVATRDGYLIISPVHVLLMDKPAEIIAELKRADLADYANGDQFFHALVADQQAEDDRAKATSYDEFKDYFRESFDLLDRVGDTSSHAERMRVNNAGGEERFNVVDRRRVRPEDDLSSAGEIPALELSDEHPPGTPLHSEVVGVHD
jgi:hypothetical protein